MPFKSEAQRRLFWAKVNRGEISRPTAEKWERHTSPGDLPERVKKAEFHGLFDELEKIAKAKEEKPSVWKRLRKAGPAIGTALGAGYAIARKRAPKKALKPILTGTSLGWMPDVITSGVEAARGK